jgi:hypothetical protein
MKKLNELPVFVSAQLENTDTGRQAWLALPASKAQFADAIESIGAERGNFRIADYNGYGTGLTAAEAMRTPLSVMNYLAYRLRRLTPHEILILRAISVADYIYFTQAGQVIDFTFRASEYRLLHEITDAEKLRRYYLGDTRADVPAEKPRQTIDRHEYGKKLAELQDGAFTSLGYLTSRIGWERTNEIRPVPDSLNLRGLLNEDLYGDWERWDCGA